MDTWDTTQDAQKNELQMHTNEGGGGEGKGLLTTFGEFLKSPANFFCLKVSPMGNS